MNIRSPGQCCEHTGGTIFKSQISLFIILYNGFSIYIEAGINIGFNKHTIVFISCNSTVSYGCIIIFNINSAAQFAGCIILYIKACKADILLSGIYTATLFGFVIMNDKPTYSYLIIPDI